MVQNHLLQLLCLVAMEPPCVLEADNARDEKLKVLKITRLFNQNTVVEETVEGQYARGNISGESILSYLEDIGQFNSDTETLLPLGQPLRIGVGQAFHFI